MSIFDRLSNGWKIGKMSLKTIMKNPSLMVFPVISSFSLMLVTLSYFGGGFFLFGADMLAVKETISSNSFEMIFYFLLFTFYVINYFIIVFFNVGLVHCAKMILEGKETTIGTGVSFAFSRINTIFAWAILAATVGMILKIIQERTGPIGSIVTSLIGMVWGIATFFVVPVIAHEDVNPIQAVKRSGQIVKEKWGESLGANFSFGLFTILGVILIVLPIGYILGAVTNFLVGIAVAVILFLIMQTAVSAANMVFLAAAYEHVNNRPSNYFESDVLDDIFTANK